MPAPSTPTKPLRTSASVLSPVKFEIRHIRVIRTLLNKACIVLSKKDESLKCAWLTQLNDDHNCDWAGRCIKSPIVPQWKESTTCWEYVSDDVPHDELLEYLKYLQQAGGLLDHHTSIQQQDTIVPEMLMHSSESLSIALRAECCEHSCDPSQLGVNIDLTNWFGANADGDAIAAGLLDCKKRKAEEAAAPSRAWKMRRIEAQTGVGTGAGSSGSSAGGSLT